MRRTRAPSVAKGSQNQPYDNEKNRKNHPELDSATSKSILERSLYNPDLIGQSQPITKPNYKVAVQTGDRNAVTILDVEQDKDHVEIVGWRNIDEDGFERLKRQAAREGGQFLILRPSEEGQPGALSGRPSGLTAGIIAKSAEEVKTTPQTQRPRRFKRINEDEWGINAHITLGKERNDIFLDEDGYIEDFGEVKRACCKRVTESTL